MKGDDGMNIIMRQIGELIPYENNPRINDKAVKAVAKSIEEFGFKNPVIVDADSVIICGHTRVKAALQLGIDEVPCIVADDLTDKQVQAFRLADNKTAEIAEWDLELLDLELKELDGIFDMTGFGFDLAKEDDEPEEDNYQPELPAQPKAHVGDVYLLGEHRLMCGDSTNSKDVKKLAGGGDR